MALTKVTNAPGSYEPPDDDFFKKRWPMLWEYLTLRCYDDAKKTPRKTATLTFFSRDDGRLGATLNDKDNARACFAVERSFLGVLDVLESLCDHQDTIWREDRQQTGSSARKKDR